MAKILVIVGLMIVGLVVLSIIDNSNPRIVDTNENVLPVDDTDMDEGQISVKLIGEVKNPGTYIMEEGSKLEDLIACAGGVTDNADERCYTLDYLLENKMEFYIAPLYDESEVCSTTPLVKYNVNTATLEELKSINGVRENAAKGIISYRIGFTFKRLEEVLNAEYVGTSTFERMKNYITLR